jgi:multiple sugar transport system substrate-binding protein
MLKGLGAAAAGAALAACQPKTVVVEKIVTQEVEKVVKETVIVEGTPQVVEKVVKETVVVEQEGSNIMAKAADEAIVSAAGAGQVVLDYWNGLTGDDGVVMIKIVQQFAQQNPEVTVKMQRIPWGIYFEKLMPAFVAGAGPDLFILHAPGEVYEWARRDIPLTLDEMFDDGMLPKEDFDAKVLTNCTFEGETVAIPMDSYCPVLWLNLDVFEEAGVEYDPERGPLTRDEFIEICTQLTWDENGNHPNEPGFDPERVDTYAYGTNDMVGTTYRQNGVDAVSMDGSCKAMITDPRFIDGLQWGHDIVHKYHFKSGEHWSADEQRLAAGKLAMNGNGSWFYDWFRLHPEVPNKAVWPWPTTGEEPGLWTGTHGLCLPADGDPEKIEWGKKLIQFISDSHMWAAEAGMPTPRKSVATHPLIATNWALPTEIEQQEWAYAPNTSYPCPSEVGGILNPAIATVLNGEMEPLEAMQDIEPRIQQVLDRCCTG